MVEKYMIEKSGVEKSGVEMSFNHNRRYELSVLIYILWLYCCASSRDGRLERSDLSVLYTRALYDRSHKGQKSKLINAHFSQHQLE